MGNYQKAAHAYQQPPLSTSDARKCISIWAWRIRNLADLAAARACYDKTLELDPNQPGAMWNLALVLEQQNVRPLRASPTTRRNIATPVSV
jgi:hypothetical protein